MGISELIHWDFNNGPSSQFQSEKLSLQLYEWAFLVANVNRQALVMCYLYI